MSIFIKAPHDETLDWHEWITLGKRERIDRIGRRHAQGWGLDNAAVWKCNNTDCPALAYVPDGAVVELIEAATNG